MAERLDDVWSWRDYPVLLALTGSIDESGEEYPRPSLRWCLWGHR